MFKSITALCVEAHTTAVSKGWYETPPSFGEAIALMHTELSEAMEAYRTNEETERIAEELADACIRIFDTCAFMGLDLGWAIQTKMAYNKSRTHKHGGKRL